MPENASQDSGLDVSYINSKPAAHKASRGACDAQDRVSIPEITTEKTRSGSDVEALDQVDSSPDQPQKVNKNYLQIVGSAVSNGLETFFYRLGHGIACRPWTVILCCFLVSALCGLGMTRFVTKDSSEPIWIPVDSKVLANQRWVERVFPVKVRTNVLIVSADNILSPGALLEIYEIDKAVKELTEYNNSIDDVYNFNWTSICVRSPEQCLSKNILELWNFDLQEIQKMDSTDKIINYLATVKKSPVYGDDYNLEDWLGDLTYDTDGKIISAKCTKMVYLIKATSSDELNTRIRAPDLLWETKFIELGLKFDEKEDSIIKAVDVQAIRSFRDQSDKSLESDMALLAVGILIIIIYVAVVMGKFNEVEHKVYLALIGVFGIGQSILVCYGLSSVLGQFYGPIHPILPFLLLGLGVDDMFVIIEAWNNLSSSEKQRPLPEKIALTMKHAGVSITVTSTTNFVAFSIGATTALPSLRSFCVFAALGILFLFLMQSTFFVAWLTIDQRRQDAYRDACCIWIKYYNYEPNSCSQRQFLPWIMREHIGPSMVTLPIKVLIVTLGMCLLGISCYGAIKLKTDSELSWFLPTNSYLVRFIKKYESSFDEGITAKLYLGNISYFNETEKIEKLVDELKGSGYLQPNSVSNWHSAYLDWLKTEEAENVAYYGFNFELKSSYPSNATQYYLLLNAFVGLYDKQYYPYLKWNSTNPKLPRHVEASYIKIRFKRFEHTEKSIECLNYLEDMVTLFYGSESFVWSPTFRDWETNRVIANELYTNLGLAFGAVFIVTLLLVANIWVCVLVCLSVVITVVNVCGMMYYWNLTIDILTSILLILSIGLAIDYSAHVGHTFMTVAGSRNERAQNTVATIGPAIVNGGFSTFLAFVLLATSDSYVFITFFKVFFLVVVFGLFNGLCVLPVVLSWIGPYPYLNATHRVTNSDMSVSLKEISGSKRADLDKILCQGKRGFFHQTSNIEKVEQYIESLPEQQGLIVNESFSRDYGEDAANCDENEKVIDNMLDELESSMQTASVRSSAAPEKEREGISFHDHVDIYKNCESYLNNSNASDT